MDANIGGKDSVYCVRGRTVMATDIHMLVECVSRNDDCRHTVTCGSHPRLFTNHVSDKHLFRWMMSFYSRVVSFES